MPSGATQAQFFAVCLLCGVGFTMSLFIGGLAFEGQGGAFGPEPKLGVLGSTVLAGLLLGVAVMLAAPANPNQ